MKRTPLMLIAALSFAAPAAFAQMSVEDQKNERQDDVSQINGQLVKVGEHNEYHYTFKPWNVSVNPIGWIVGMYSASVSYAFHPNIAVRADAGLYDSAISDDQGYEAGLTVPIYLRRVYEGVYLEPGVLVRQIKNRPYNDHTSTTAGPQVLVGWHTTSDSGLNVSAAFGLGRNLIHDDKQDYYGNEKVFPTGYLRFGYAF